MTGERNRIMAIVALPLVVLLTVLSVLDALRLKAETTERERARLTDAATDRARQLNERLARVHQAARLVQEVVESSVGMDDTALYSLLARTVEQEESISSAAMLFGPGGRLAGAHGPELESELPVVAREPLVAADARDPWFGPAVIRGAGMIGRTDLAGTALGAAWLRRSRETNEGWALVESAEAFAPDGQALHWNAIREGMTVRRSAVMLEVGEAAFKFAPLPKGAAAHLIHSGTGLPIGSRDSADTVAIEPRAFRAAVAPDPSGEHRTEKEMELAVAGELSIAAMASVSNFDLAVVVSMPRSAIMRGVYRELRQRVLAAGIVVMVLVAAAGTLGPWIMRPWRRVVGELGEQLLDLGVGSEAAAGATARVAWPTGGGVGGSGSAGGGGSGGGGSDDAIARSILASQLQTAFPRRPEFDLHAIAAPALRVGGDFYDFFAVGKETLAVVIADVAGKGVGAAMFMSATRTLVRELALAEGGGESPGAVLTRANTLLIETNPEMLFVTTFLGFYNVRTGVLVWANAGHPSPLLVRATGGRPLTEQLGRATGTVMGALPGIEYPDREAMLQVGDRVVMYTDGVSEATAPGGAMWGIEILSSLCIEQAALKCESLCREVMLAVDRFQHGRPHDDATIMALRRLR
ncbi:MAG: PP2C family protein-serine/threonine phosphatase [Phycisphaerales bacterium]